MKLGELLLSHNRITATQLNQALRSQEVYGGKLGTNLVELGYLTETDLTQFLSQQLKLPAAQPGDFTAISEKVLSLIPKEFARKYRVIPINFQNNKLRVAFGDPLDLEAREQTAFRVGHSIIPLIAPEILINYALEKFYKIPYEKRYLTLNEDEETSFNELVMRNQFDEIMPIGGAKPTAAGKAAPSPKAPNKKAAASPAVYTLKSLSQDLCNCTHRDEVFRAVFRLLESQFDHIAVFVQRQNELWGWTQQGFKRTPLELRRKLMTLTDHPESVFSKVFFNRDLVLSAHLTGEDANLASWLGGTDAGWRYHLFPMLVNGKVLATFFVTSGADTSGYNLPIEHVEMIQEALTKGSIGMQILRLRRKLMNERSAPLQDS